MMPTEPAEPSSPVRLLPSWPAERSVPMMEDNHHSEHAREGTMPRRTKDRRASDRRAPRVIIKTVAPGGAIEPVAFGDRLRAAREAAGLTQTEAAERLGFTQSEWSAAENGRQSCYATYVSARRRAKASYDRISDIAKIVGRTAEDLIN